MGRNALRLSLSLAILLVPGISIAAISGFIESFDGDGDYPTIDGDFQGLDNAGWEIRGDGRFEDGGFVVENQGEPQTEREARDVLVREVFGHGRFATRLRINRLDLGERDEWTSMFSGSGIVLRQNLDLATGRGASRLLIGLSQNDELGEQTWTLNMISGANGVSESVPRGSNVVLGIDYDDRLSQTTFVFDNDVADDVPALIFGPLRYTETFADVHTTSLICTAILMGVCDGVIDNWSMLPLSDVPGGFDGNGILDVGDLNRLSEQVRAATNDSLYDLNDDALVNDLDREVWVHDLKQTYFGDADLNGSFDRTDLVQVLASGEYEDGVALNSTWLTGDWDGDGDFTSGDLVTALADGGYEAGSDTAAVPEPASILVAIVAGAFVAIRPRGCAKTRRA